MPSAVRILKIFVVFINNTGSHKNNFVRLGESTLNLYIFNNLWFEVCSNKQVVVIDFFNDFIFPDYLNFGRLPTFRKTYSSNSKLAVPF
jgi:hypothetical protein